MRPERAWVRACGLVLTLTAFPLMLSGCFAMQKDLDPIRSDISVMEKQFMELQREQAMIRAGEGGMLPGTPDNTAERLDRIEARLNAIEKRLGVVSGTAAPSAPQAMPPEPVTVEPIPEAEPQPPVLVTPGVESQPPVLVTPGTAPTTPSRVTMAAEDIYAQSMKKYKDGDLNGAEAGFQSILDEYPDNRLADNALYWIGEIQFMRKEFAKAIDSFKRVVSDYPIGDKVPDAVYMMGRSYEETGQTDKAKDAYNRVMDNYPYSDAARNARQRMGGIN